MRGDRSVGSAPEQLQGASLAGHRAGLARVRPVRDEQGISALLMGLPDAKLLLGLPPASWHRQRCQAVSARNREKRRGVAQLVSPLNGVVADLARRGASERRVGEPQPEARPVSPRLARQTRPAPQEERLLVSRAAVLPHPPGQPQVEQLPAQPQAAVQALESRLEQEEPLRPLVPVEQQAEPQAPWEVR